MASSPTPKDTVSTGVTPDTADKAPSVQKDLRFWLIIVALAATSLLVALEVTIVSTGTATIVAQLGGQSSYVWIPAAYLLALTSLQPLFGQLAEVFGRRWPFILSICIFMLGSGVCGGANSMAMLIAGRIIQGIGGAGANVLAELIVCDLVPLRERGSIMAIVFGASALGPAVGPVIGGAIVQQSTWRWIFYINLPLGAVGLGLAVLFLRMRNDNKTGFVRSLARIDWTGNAIFVAACTSTLIATTWGGTVYPWTSARVLVPLIVGLVGITGFIAFEGFPKLAPNPIMPHCLFGNHTTIIVFFNTFLQGTIVIAVLYFLPVYFQAVLLSSPGRSGVQLLPMVMLQIVGAIVGGGLLEKLGHYHALHAVSFGGSILGIGLLTMLNPFSSAAEWAVFQVILAIALGLGIPIMLPVAQARLKDSDAASSTALWGFLRAFGMVWGSVIPAAAFNNRFVELAPSRITDPAVRAAFAGQGQALEHAVATAIKALPEPSRSEVISVFSDSLKRTWYVLMAFPALAFVLVFFMEKVELRKELDTAYGMEKRPEEKSESTGV
ncbi:hypothetical protein KJ359_000014 [Pestalotiopsis sp. 9143b]|nr:hypothetical protein KJ359_000014 [Pestalotiopsis sp. 9143b]